MRRPALVPTLVAVLFSTGCGGGTTPTSTATVEVHLPPKPGCIDVSKPKPRNPGTLKPPTTRLDPSKRLDADIRHDLRRVRRAPRAEDISARDGVTRRARAQGYFDRTIFHRIVPGFVIQGGDPTQTGAGGPGYATVDTPKVATRYVKGVVAMATTATEPRGAAGSQFFVMTADAPSLPPTTPWPGES